VPRPSRRAGKADAHPPDHKAPSWLGALAAFVHFEPLDPAAVALAELKSAHQADPLPADQAIREAFDLLAGRGELDGVLQRIAGTGTRASWPFLDDRPEAV
jgi:hypothetical protein